MAVIVGRWRCAAIVIGVVAVVGGCGASSGGTTANSTSVSSSTTPSPAPASRLEDAQITGWLKPGSCTPGVRRDHPRQCGVVSIDTAVHVTADHPLSVRSGGTRADAVSVTMSPGGRAIRYISSPLPTLITDTSRRAVGGTIALGHTLLLPDERVTGNGPQPVQIDAVAFLPSPLAARQPALPAGHYLVWVVLVNDDVEPTTVAAPLDLAVTTGQ